MMTQGIDLRQYATAQITWWEKYETELGGDFCKPQYTGNGTTWGTLVAQYSGSSGGWIKRTADLTNYCPTAATFKVRFLLSSNATTSGDGWYVDDISIVGYTPEGVSGAPALPALPGISLGACYPNPAANNSSIRYALDKAQEVRISVYDITGRVVVQLVDAIQGAGTHSATWNGKNERGQAVPNGVYLVRVSAGNYQATRKLTVVR
jgi:hypothetical protein